MLCTANREAGSGAASMSTRTTFSLPGPLLSKLLERGLDPLAGAAPLGPEVDEDRHRSGDLGVEGRGVGRDQPWKQGVACSASRNTLAHGGKAIALAAVRAGND